MSLFAALSPLFSPRAYRLPTADIHYPLGARLPSDRIGFVSIGPGGIITSVVRTKKGVPSVVSTEESPHVVGQSGWPELFKKLKKQVGGFGDAPVILGVSAGLEYFVRHNAETTSQAEFVYQVRTDPAKVISAPNDNSVYTGFLAETSATGLIMGVNRVELAAAEEALAKAGCIVIRKVVPMLSVFNIMLADPRVTSGEMMPLIADQGVAVCIPTQDGLWQDPHGRSFVGNGTTKAQLSDLIAQIHRFTPGQKFLVHASGANGPVSVMNTLAEANATVEPFIIPGVASQNLIPYAAALF